MPRLALLDPTQHGRPAEHLANKLMRVVWDVAGRTA